MTTPALRVIHGDQSTLVLYDEMCRAIDAAYQVDEVKTIRDKALAWEAYSRLAKNIDAERRACEIRLRAESKAGALLKQMQKAQAGRKPKIDNTVLSNSAPTLRDLGISPKQSSDWQRLADVPRDVFEAALADPNKKPSTAGIIAAATPPDPERVPVSPAALWLWGRLRDFERDGIITSTPADVMLTMTPSMLDDVHRLAPRVAEWLSQIGKCNV